MVQIKGLQPLTLIDYPGKVACTVFLGGCNFRCPFCYNIDLVLRPKKLHSIPEEEFFNFLKKRKGWLDGVCIGGGEPTIYADLPIFISKIKSLGFLVKLDTNGSNPEMIKRLLRKKLLDYIAMDIKTRLNPKKYSEAVGVKADIEKIKKSITIIKKSKIDYEFRTTCIPKLVSKEDLIAIGKSLRAKRFVIQQFENKKTINPKFQKIKPYSKEELENFAECLKPYFNEVKLRI